MTFNSYDFGSTVILQANFADPSGNPIDPSTVTLRILDPNKLEAVHTTAEFTHQGTGVFTFAVVVMAAGVWYYRFEGLGAVSAVQDGNFVVTSTPFLDAAA